MRTPMYEQSSQTHPDLSVKSCASLTPSGLTLKIKIWRTMGPLCQKMCVGRDVLLCMPESKHIFIWQTATVHFSLTSLWWCLCVREGDRKIFKDTLSAVPSPFQSLTTIALSCLAVCWRVKEKFLLFYFAPVALLCREAAEVDEQSLVNVTSIMHIRSWFAQAFHVSICTKVLLHDLWCLI